MTPSQNVVVIVVPFWSHRRPPSSLRDFVRHGFSRTCLCGYSDAHLRGYSEGDLIFEVAGVVLCYRLLLSDVQGVHGVRAPNMLVTTPAHAMMTSTC